jgi:16S rRNA (guanine527-N7)-methyltransferase
VSVSRETAPDPTVVEALFPQRDKLIHRYVDLLATDGVTRGLIGPRELPRLWSRHIVNCAVARDLLPHEARVADVGSGAGLPGVVLALSRPDVELTLIEPLLRRVTFLREVVAELGLDNVTVLRTRAEDLSGEPGFDVVTARAVAPLITLVRWTLPLCVAGGEVIAYKGSSAATELDAAAAVVAAYGGHDARIEHLDPGHGLERTTVVRIRSSGRSRPSRSSEGSR